MQQVEPVFRTLQRRWFNKRPHLPINQGVDERDNASLCLFFFVQELLCVQDCIVKDSVSLLI